MIEEGVLEGVDAAFALHVAPNLFADRLALRAGAVLAATDDFRDHRARAAGGTRPRPSGRPTRFRSPRRS